MTKCPSTSACLETHHDTSQECDLIYTFGSHLDRQKPRDPAHVALQCLASVNLIVGLIPALATKIPMSVCQAGQARKNSRVAQGKTSPSATTPPRSFATASFECQLISPAISEVGRPATSHHLCQSPWPFQRAH